MGQKAEKYRFQSIAKRLPLMFSIGYLVLLTFVGVITYFREERRMIEEYRRMADGVTNLMIEALDPDKMDYYIEENFSSQEYLDILKYYYSLKDNYPDIFYMYIYRFYESDPAEATIIIDLDEEYTDPPLQSSVEEVGTVYTALEPFASLLEELLHSREPLFETVYTREDGYLLSFAKPILDADGNYVASACVDFSMTDMHKQNIRFVVMLYVILLFVGGALQLLFVLDLRRNITNPLLSIAKTVAAFKHDTEEERSENLAALEKLGIHADNEIGILYDALHEAEEESIFYLNYFKKAEDEIQSKDAQISKLGNVAYRDSLTNVGNKTAFDMCIKGLGNKDAYAIVVMDANDLKMINDTYGHEAGDVYLKGCCRVLCEAFSHSPVFRTGGDDFAVILKGRDYKKREELLNALEEKLERIWTEKENDPEHRYSCAVGMADSSKGEGPGTVFKMADEIMYANKKAFKKKNGSYR